MRKLTCAEFAEVIEWEQTGFTWEEVVIYYSYYLMGRKSVRW